MIEIITQHFPANIEVVTGHDACVRIPQKGSYEVLRFLKENPACDFNMLLDLCGVDYLSQAEKQGWRFEVVYHLYSLHHGHRLRVRVKMSEEPLAISTVTNLWKAADWFEREASEMFGFRFEGHENLKPLLLHEGFEGFPLRKDYPIARRQKIPLPLERPTS